MHYYKRHIGDYRAATAHLTLLEHGVYAMLMDLYYLDEKPFPLETQSVYRRLRAVTEEERAAVDAVLSDFFVKGENGYQHKRIDSELAGYLANAEKNRENGKAGGRPKKTQSVSDGMPAETQVEPTHNLNQEPQTKNQEPQTKKGKDKPSAARFDAQAHLVALGVEKQIARDWLRVRKGKSAAPTETAFDLAASEAAKAGMTLNDALRVCIEMSWAGFKASWVDEDGKPHERFRSGGAAGMSKDPNVIPGWWKDDELAKHQAALVGVSGPHPTDTRDTFHARISAAIENGGKPPTPVAAATPKPVEPEAPKVELTVEQVAERRAALLGALKKNSIDAEVPPA
jgi:uncharacterized protein YdaU (DUF1376 family)